MYPARDPTGMVFDDWTFDWNLFRDGRTIFTDRRVGVPTFIAGASAIPGTLAKLPPAVAVELESAGFELFSKETLRQNNYDHIWFVRIPRKSSMARRLRSRARPLADGLCTRSRKSAGFPADRLLRRHRLGPAGITEPVRRQRPGNQPAAFCSVNALAAGSMNADEVANEIACRIASTDCALERRVNEIAHALRSSPGSSTNSSGVLTSSQRGNSPQPPRTTERFSSPTTTRRRKPAGRRGAGPVRMRRPHCWHDRFGTSRDPNGMIPSAT